MATWWEITFTGEPTKADFRHVSEMVAQGFTSGQLINEPGAELEEGPATGYYGPGDPRPGQPGNPVMFADEGDGHVTVLDSGYNPLEYNIPRDQAERDYPEHRPYDELGAQQ